MSIKWKDVKAKILANPLVREEYDRLDKEFKAARPNPHPDPSPLPKPDPSSV